MKRHTGPQQPFAKIADVLPKGFDVEAVESFFAKGAGEQPAHGAKIAPLHVTIDNLPVIGPSMPELSQVSEHLSSLHGKVAALLGAHGVLDAYTDDLDGFARSMIKGGGGGGGNGGGKGKNAATTTDPATDPATTDQTDAGTTTTGTTSPTSTTTTTTTTIPAADYVSGKDTPDGYNVELVFKGTWSDEAKAAAYAAAENISDMVTGDLPDYNGIDDIRITLTSTSIDGTGGTWGKGGTDILRSGSYLPSTGHVTIDAADIPNALKLGLLDDLLEHEMMHAMGFGTTWSAMGLVDNYNGDLRFNGANATHAYNTFYSSLAANDPLSDKGVPIETDGGSGAAGKHWDETTFGKEIMTTTLNYSNTVSPLTIAALEDMGYQTTYADEFLFA